MWGASASPGGKGKRLLFTMYVQRARGRATRAGVGGRVWRRGEWGKRHAPPPAVDRLSEAASHCAAQRMAANWAPDMSGVPPPKPPGGGLFLHY